jgi:hypothetical protein
MKLSKKAIKILYAVAAMLKTIFSKECKLNNTFPGDGIMNSSKKRERNHQITK